MNYIGNMLFGGKPRAKAFYIDPDKVREAKGKSSCGAGGWWHTLRVHQRRGHGILGPCNECSDRGNGRKLSTALGAQRRGCWLMATRRAASSTRQAISPTGASIRKARQVRVE